MDNFEDISISFFPFVTDLLANLNLLLIFEKYHVGNYENT